MRETSKFYVEQEDLEQVLLPNLSFILDYDLEILITKLFE